jgi:hypothetical protein
MQNEITISTKHGRHLYLICDSEGFAKAAESHAPLDLCSEWSGNISIRESIHQTRNGDLSSVSESDTFMNRLEDQVFASSGWKNIYDVVGAVPSIPAYIAGVPECMRRRARTTTDTSPLAVCVDLTSSGGINAKDVKKRGIAILALVRLLANIRPIELYANVALGKDGFAGEIVCKIETTPLDLARAAHILTHPSVSRGMGYKTLQNKYHTSGGWPYGDVDRHRTTGRENLLRVLPVQDLLYMPPIFAHDAAIKEPVKWIKAMLKQYGGPSVVEE